jgi:CRISPR-associated protein Cpf1
MKNNFTNLYSLSKTLRFELIPQDGVKNYIEKQQLAKVDGKPETLLAQDFYRKNQREKYKLLIDSFHKWFIDKSLNEFSKNVSYEFQENLKIHFEQFLNKKKFDKQNYFRLELATYFKRADEVAVESKMKNFMLPDKEANYCIIKEWFESEDYQRNFEDDQKTINSFNGFFTYLKNYNDIRKNLYKADGKAGTIGNRLFNKNLNLFCFNIKLYNDLPLDIQKKINDEWEKSDIFQIENYTDFLTQVQIDWFNQMIGNKPVETGNRQSKGLNAIINEENQKRKKNEKLKFFKKLQNQILFREKDNSYNRKVNSNDDVKSILNELVFNQNFLLTVQNQIGIVNNESYDGIFVSKRNIPKLSKYIFSEKINESHFVIKEGLKLLAEHIIEKTKTTINKKGEEVKKTKTETQLQTEINGFLKQEYFSLEQIDEAIKLKIESNDDFENFSLLRFLKELKPNIAHDVLDKNEEIITKNEIFDIAKEFESETLKIKQLINNDTINWDEPLFKNEHKNSELKPIEKIKSYLDTLLKIAQYSLLFKVDSETLEKEVLDTDADFYNQFETTSDIAFKIINAHKEIAAFVSQKEYSKEKTKLYIENKGNFLGGFVSSNGNMQGGAFIFRKPNKEKFMEYYIGISSNSKLFDINKKINKNDISDYERLDYYQMKTNSFYGSSFLGKYGKGFNEYTNGLSEDEVIKLLKELIKEKYLHKIPVIKNLLDKSYTDLKDFRDSLQNFVSKNKSLMWVNISNDEIHNSINDENDRLLLFKIQNKDLKYLPNKKNQNANKNLHTLYFEELMKGNQTTFDLGTGEVFFRKSSIKHDDTILKNGHHFNDEKNLKDKFKDQYSKYENSKIISNKRFTENKYFLHLSININYTAESDVKKYNIETLNKNTLKFLQQNPDYKIIGIDRGERHLLYCSVINSAGKIEKQFTLNSIENENFKPTNYIEKLDQREKERIKSRQNWDTVNKISDLKTGYVSQAVHKIVLELKANDYKAIVVFEDLNAGFKKKRSVREKSVYQQIESALINKLSYIVEKQNNNSLHNALQLTKPDSVESQDKIKQNGFVFYIPAAFTSKIDPTTGFMYIPYAINLTFESTKKARLLFEKKISNFKFNHTEKYFQFDLNLKHNTKVDKKEIEVMDKVFTICSHGAAIRFHYSEKNKTNTPINVTERLEKLLEKHISDWKNSSNLESRIQEVSDESFFKELLYLLRVLLTLRHTDTNGNDNIISPVLNKYNKFYNSSDYKNYDIMLPENADANGAFHIALKGKFLIDKILSNGYDNLKDEDYKYSNVEWYNDLNNFHND